ncbi:hypothetical protein JCM3765_004974 [Sporobolomyces pararoseus]
MNPKKPSSKSSTSKKSTAPVSSTSSTSNSKKRSTSTLPTEESSSVNKRAKRSVTTTTGRKSLREEELGVGGEIGSEDDDEEDDQPQREQEDEEDELTSEDDPDDKKKKSSSSSKKEQEEEDDEEDDDDGGDGGVTRCVCGDDNEEMSSGLMIQCDTCKCWQHGPCVDLWEEKECPNRYFCELCKPHLHGPGGLLRKASRGKSSTGATSAPNSTSANASASTSVPPEKRRQTRSPSLSTKPLPSHSPPPQASSSTSTKPTTSSTTTGKKRSTMNSRDAAYDDAIALSILEAGGAARRDKLEGRDRSESDGEDESGNIAKDSEVVAEKKETTTGKKGKGRAGSAGSTTTGGGKGAGKKAGAGTGKGKAAAKSKAKTDNSASNGESTLVVPKIETLAESQDEDNELDESNRKRKNISPELGGEKEKQVEKDGEDEVMKDVEDQETEQVAEVSPPTLQPVVVVPPPPVPAPAAPTHRAKHPNQYTYRPKNGTAGATATSKKGTGTAGASPTKPSATSKSSTSKGSKDKTSSSSVSVPTNSTTNPSSQTTTTTPSNLVLGEKEREKLQWAQELGIHLSWSIPEHLKHLSHLLPSPLPDLINVPTSGAGGTTSNGKGGGEKELYQEYQDQFIQATSNLNSTNSNGETTEELPFETHYEPPTKVRFPGKRVTMPEMKKRVKSLSEYLERVRQEVSDREKKDEVLRRAIEANRSRTTAAGVLGGGSSSSANGTGSGSGSGNTSKETSPPLPPTTSTTMGTSGISENTLSFVESLSRDLVMFRERFDS